MELQELYHLIGLPPEIIQKLNLAGGQIDLQQLDGYLKQLTDIHTAPSSYRALKALFRDDPDNIHMLYCQLECARRVFGRYQEKQIAKRVYSDTMKCFTRFIEECKKKNGRMFFDRGWWTYRQISMNIFRIGELEYEFTAHDGENALGIHIPSDADLSEEAVDDSLGQAKRFFQAYYSGYEAKFYTCNSWLLSPALRPLLSESSNILAFQNRFAVIRENKEDTEFIEWLFQVPADTAYPDLPEKTSLQKTAKELLLHGGAVGSAYGLLREPETLLTGKKLP